MMRASHIAALLFLSVWCVFSVWVGADSFGVGECVAVALIWAGLWVAFAILRSLNQQRRDGRAPWPVAVITLSLILTCNALRPRVSEVSVAYTSTASFTQLSALTEAVRWR